ncbi:hypothetical protein [Ornithinibacillus hominis]|uniref:hypothetical protein n=1 Tax=Ornithinibacillus hominis TaxID=2763055 RepID=UPI001C9B3D92|nr:hypothetical protein [Ornithinibacillus hominis]
MFKIRRAAVQDHVFLVQIELNSPQNMHLRFRVAQLTALAMKDTYDCDGITTRQHNEPAGSQDVWHYYLHVYLDKKNDFFI